MSCPTIADNSDEDPTGKDESKLEIQNDASASLTTGAGSSPSNTASTDQPSSFGEYHPESGFGSEFGSDKHEPGVHSGESGGFGSGFGEDLGSTSDSTSEEHDNTTSPSPPHSFVKSADGSPGSGSERSPLDRQSTEPVDDSPSRCDDTFNSDSEKGILDSRPEEPVDDSSSLNHAVLSGSEKSILDRPSDHEASLNCIAASDSERSPLDSQPGEPVDDNSSLDHADLSGFEKNILDRPSDHEASLNCIAASDSERSPLDSQPGEPVDDSSSLDHAVLSGFERSILDGASAPTDEDSLDHTVIAWSDRRPLNAQIAKSADVEHSTYSRSAAVADAEGGVSDPTIEPAAEPTDSSSHSNDQLDRTFGTNLGTTYPSGSSHHPAEPAPTPISSNVLGEFTTSPATASSAPVSTFQPLNTCFATVAATIAFSCLLSLLLIPSNMFGDKLSFGLSVLALFAFMFQSLALLFGACGFGVWISTAYKNLKFGEVKPLRFSAPLFMVCAAVPVVNAVISYWTLEELWKASDPDEAPQSWKSAPSSGLVLAWALTWIFGTQITSWLLLLSDFNTDAASKTSINTIAWAAGSIFFTAAGILCVDVLKKITERQQRKFTATLPREYTKQNNTPAGTVGNVLIPLAALAGTLPCIISSIMTTGAYSTLETAKEAFNSGNYDKAVALMKTVRPGAANWVISDPFTIFRGQCYLKQGKFEDALSEFNSIIKANPYCMDAWIARGEAFHEREQYLNAVADFTHIIDEYPTNAQAFYDRALTYFSMKQYTDSMQDADKAVEIEPLNEKVHSLRADILTAQEQYRPAIFIYQKANSLSVDENGKHRDNADLIYNMAVCYQNLNDVDNARKNFLEAARIYRTNGMAEEAKDAEDAAKDVDAPKAAAEPTHNPFEASNELHGSKHLAGPTRSNSTKSIPPTPAMDNGTDVDKSKIPTIDTNNSQPIFR